MTDELTTDDPELDFKKNHDYNRFERIGRVDAETSNPILVLAGGFLYLFRLPWAY
ncbi:MAG: hypothetical protein LBT86_06770 [Deltaproteobacteria bacterium]|nr:hypothetical protein [Deltaproteobacteria bacterium]